MILGLNLKKKNFFSPCQSQVVMYAWISNKSLLDLITLGFGDFSEMMPC